MIQKYFTENNDDAVGQIKIKLKKKRNGEIKKRKSQTKFSSEEEEGREGKKVIFAAQAAIDFMFSLLLYSRNHLVTYRILS